MQELREQQLGNDNLIGLKDVTVRGGILPERASQLQRTIHVQGNVVVDGGVYAEAIEIDDGPCEFRNALFANRELHIKTTAKQDIIFRKAVACGNTVSAFVMGGRVLFGADINADVVRLKNCYVGGSIFATTVELENCVVIGGVFASQRLSVSESMVGTFHAPSVTLNGINYLFYPTAFSVEPLVRLPNACLYSLALADLGALYKGDQEAQGSGKILIDLNADAQRTVLVDEDGSNILVNSYSVATRVLASDLASPGKLENHFLLTAGALGTQLQREYTLVCANGEASDTLTIEHISAFLFDVLSGKIAVADLDGRVTFEELKAKFG